MKIFLALISAVLLLGIAGCVSNNSNDAYTPAQYPEITHEDAQHTDEILDISGPLFAQHIQEIQLNRNYYLGRTIRYEGMFLSMYWEPTNETIYFVAQIQGSGCCGIHGFEVYLNDILPLEDETLVEVTGVLEEFFDADAGGYILRVNIISMVETVQE